ncbi:hypothetical protein QFZ97_008205 [Paraburkholderia youngii]
MIGSDNVSRETDVGAEMRRSTAPTLLRLSLYFLRSARVFTMQVPPSGAMHTPQAELCGSAADIFSWRGPGFCAAFGCDAATVRMSHTAVFATIFAPTESHRARVQCEVRSRKWNRERRTQLWALPSLNPERTASRVSATRASQFRGMQTSWQQKHRSFTPISPNCCGRRRWNGRLPRSPLPLASALCWGALRGANRRVRKHRRRDSRNLD